MLTLLTDSKKQAKANSPTASHPPNMVEQNIDIGLNSRRQLPNELIEVIVEHIKEDGNLKTLAAIARASQHMYDIVIPKLYETVKVTAKNEKYVAYGHSHCHGMSLLNTAICCLHVRRQATQQATEP
jgi:hypothetical protein